MTELEILLLNFFEIWEGCEGNRGCYSCCPQHDVRCSHSGPGISMADCECGRDDLEATAEAIRTTK